MSERSEAVPERMWAFGLTLGGLAALPTSALLEACEWDRTRIVVMALSMPVLLWGLVGCTLLAADGGWLRTAMRVGPAAFVTGAILLGKLGLVADSAALFLTTLTVGLVGFIALVLLARRFDDLPDV